MQSLHIRAKTSQIANLCQTWNRDCKRAGLLLPQKMSPRRQSTQRRKSRHKLDCSLTCSHSSQNSSRKRYIRPRRPLLVQYATNFAGPMTQYATNFAGPVMQCAMSTETSPGPELLSGCLGTAAGNTSRTAASNWSSCV